VPRTVHAMAMRRMKGSEASVLATVKEEGR
jgi:hypothetical protein